MLSGRADRQLTCFAVPSRCASRDRSLSGMGLIGASIGYSRMDVIGDFILERYQVPDSLCLNFLMTFARDADSDRFSSKTGHSEGRGSMVKEVKSGATQYCDCFCLCLCEDRFPAFI
jgi:hypothetical protein